MTKVTGGYQCDMCDLKVKTLYSTKRHITNQHKEVPCSVSEVSSHTTDLERMLVKLALEQYKDIFRKEEIDLDTLVDLEERHFMEMVKGIGIVPWGHRHKLREGIGMVKEGTLVLDGQDAAITPKTVCD